MKRLALILSLVILVGSVVTVFALTMEKLELSDGRSDGNYILGPVFDTEGIGGLQIGNFEPAYDQDGFVMFKQTKSLLGKSPKYPKPRYKMDPSIDLGALLAEALGTEAEAMGFEVVPEGESGASWQVTGTLHDVYVGIKQIPWGMTMFFGSMDVELHVRNGGGDESVSIRFPVFNMSQFYNAGLGLQDEAREALARLIIESAQEIVARLNREVFKAPPHPDTVALATVLEPNQKDPENRLLQFGLSGYAPGVPLLLGILDQEKDENDRVHMINALANIGSSEAVDALAERYGNEDEDCRYFTLKAMSYIGSSEAIEFVAREGAHDKKLACRVVAQRAVDAAR